MANVTPELIILVLGILGVIAGIHKMPDLKTTPKWAIYLFGVGLLTQIATQMLQYANVVKYRESAERIAERQVAFALHALAEKDVRLLKSVAKDNPYVIGYALFKNKDLVGAAAHFKASLDRETFIAPSHYMLAYLILQDPDGDWTKAREHLDSAIKVDSKYASAYYLRAIVKVKAHEFPGAAQDLGMSVKFGMGQCLDINRVDEVQRLWTPIANSPDFQQMQRECLSLYEIPSSKEK